MAPREPRRSGQALAVGGGPWDRSPCLACGQASWAGRRAVPWRREGPGACGRGSARRVGGGGGRSRLAGRGRVAVGRGSRHMGQVAYLIIGEARVAAALSRPRDRDQLEADALNKYK